MSEISVDPRKTVCRECKSTDVVLDYHSGDLVCTGCGLVLEGRCIDDGQEWRNFNDEGAGYGQKVNERERADKSAAHDMMDDEAAGTSITGTSVMARTLQKAQLMAQRQQSSMVDKAANAAKIEQKALKAFKARVRETTSKLVLGEGIVNRCEGIYQDLHEKNRLSGQKQASWYCAIVHIATVMEKATRTTSELAEACLPQGKKQADFEKQIDKKVKEINTALGVIMPAAYVKDPDLMARFVQRLGLANEVCKPASHISQEAYHFGVVGNKPQTAIVASSIMVVSWLLNVEEKPSFADVAQIAKTPETFVRQAYKRIVQQCSRLLPKDFKPRVPLESLPVA